MSIPQPLIDILIVTYNSDKYLPRLVPDLLKTKNLNKILIYDNDSKDQTRKFLERIDSQNITTIFSNKNIGFGKAMNILVNKSKTKYQLLINPDTRPKKKALDKLTQCAIASNSDIVGGAMIDEDGKVQRSYTRIPTPMTIFFEFTNLKKIFPNNRWHKKFLYKDISHPTDHLEVGSVSGGFMLINKHSFKKLSGFDENFFMYLEDIDICKRAHEHNMKVVYCPHARVFHIGGGSSKNKHRIHYKAWDESRIWYVKKYYKVPILWILLIAIKIDVLITHSKREQHVH